MVNITNGYMILVTLKMNNSEKMEQPPINNNINDSCNYICRQR